MKLVKWRNVWNWSSEEGGTSRLHLTNSDGLSGVTLCGREFPHRKGYPTAVRYCKTCVKKSKLTYDQIRALDSVPSSDDEPITYRRPGAFASLRDMVYTECPCGCGSKEICEAQRAAVDAANAALPF